MKSNDEMIAVVVCNDDDDVLASYFAHTSPIVGDSIMYDRLRWEVRHVAHVVDPMLGKQHAVRAYVNDYHPYVNTGELL